MSFYFSFRSFGKHQRACERARNARKKNKIFLPHPYPLALAGGNKSPSVYFLSRARDGLWRENRGSVNRLNLAEICKDLDSTTLSASTCFINCFINLFPVFSNPPRLAKASWDEDDDNMMVIFRKKHQRACERARNARKKNKIFLPHPYPLALAGGNKSPSVYFLSRARDGLWRENRGSVNRLNLAEICKDLDSTTLSASTCFINCFINLFPVFSNPPRLAKASWDEDDDNMMVIFRKKRKVKSLLQLFYVGGSK